MSNSASSKDHLSIRPVISGRTRSCFMG
ncbi:hypothetical protein A2U01_0098167, partial [Trifolium medium]|nr:hypothetical protein [Trifolium medium]